MKLFILLVFTLLGLVSLAQPGVYKDGFDEWEKESKTDLRLLPRYGLLPKTSEQLKADSIFISETMALPKFKTKRDVSNHFIKLGFQYYYRDDLKTAMYRFNQAYLLDSSNTDIFWGYGAIYLRFGMLGLSANQYKAGLKKDSSNTHLLTDYGTMFLAQYYRLNYTKALDSAIHYMTKSYKFDPNDQNTVFKLSICYWNKGDCKNAWRFYDLCKALGGQVITEEYTEDLKQKCAKDH